MKQILKSPRKQTHELRTPHPDQMSQEVRAEETAALIHFAGGHNTAGPGKGATVSRKSSPPTAGLPQAPVKSNRSRADKATIRCLPQEVPRPFRQDRLKCTGLCLAVCRSTSQQSHELTAMRDTIIHGGTTICDKHGERWE